MVRHYNDILSAAGRLVGSRTRQQAGTALMCAAGVWNSTAVADEPLLISDAEDPDTAPSVWTLAPYLWAPTFNGTVGFGPTTLSVDVKPQDSAPNFRAGGMGYLSWTKGRHFLYAEGLGISWRDRSFDPFYGQDVAGELAFVEVGYGHHFIFNAGSKGGAQIIVSPYAGVRYASLEIKVNYTTTLLSPGTLQNPDLVIEGLLSPPPDGAHDQWLDPALGVMIDAPLFGRLRSITKLDGAGFGLGPDRYWNITSGLLYRLTAHWAIGLGYRYSDVKTKPENGNDLTFDATLRGPLGGVTYQF